MYLFGNEKCCFPISVRQTIFFLFYSTQFSGPEIKFVDGGKESFKVEFKLVSSIFPKDVSLHSFFVHVDKMLDNHCNADDDSFSIISESQSETSSLCDSKRLSVSSETGRDLCQLIKVNLIKLIF